MQFQVCLTALLIAACVPPLSVAQTLPSPAGGQMQYRDPAGVSVRDLEKVTIEQRLNNRIDLDLEFTDSTGETVRLGRFFGDKPVVLALVYYECPMLCSLELNGLLKAMRAIDLEAGRDYNVVTVSFDHGESPALAAEKKDLYLRQYLQGGFYERQPLEAGWKFLVGDKENIAALAEAVGFRYLYDPTKDLYRHASGIITLTPEGNVSRYQFGVEYSARDLKFALIEASNHRIGSPADAVMLFCFHYDPATGKYGFVIMNALRLAGGATLLLLGGFVVLNLLRDRRKARQAQHDGAIG